MPLIKLDVSNVSDEQCNNLLPALSKMLAEITGKPEKYVMATVSKMAPIMAGKPGPAAFADIRGIGGFTPAVNKKVSQTLRIACEASAGESPDPDSRILRKTGFQLGLAIKAFTRSSALRRMVS
ncbi:MAG: phenylpyruvate tautomerase MIF-related protein [Syntrophales bacterium]|nr:phenylpyruvate tautomerase MIF-related protein [Syntrophales bacterium]